MSLTISYIRGLSGAVLDVGCGTGRALKVLAKDCKRVVAIDKEQGMVNLAKKKSKNLKNVEVYRQNAKKMKFKNNSFDAIVCIGNTFGNITKDKKAVLLEMKRVCKKKGKIIISVYNEKALKSRLESYKKDWLTQYKVTKTGAVYSKEGLISEQFTKKKLNKLFQKAKLKCKIIDFNPISYLCVCKK